MRSLWWVLIAVAVVVLGVVFGVAGLLLAPIVGIIAMVALFVWLAERKAEHKPPLE